MTSLKRYQDRLRIRSTKTHQRRLASLQVRPEDDQNLKDSISGLIKFDSSGSGLCPGEFSLVPPMLDGLTCCRSWSGSSASISSSCAVVSSAVVCTRDAIDTLPWFCSNRATFARRSERYLSSISIRINFFSHDWNTSNYPCVTRTLFSRSSKMQVRFRLPQLEHGCCPEHLIFCLLHREQLFEVVVSALFQHHASCVRV